MEDKQTQDDEQQPAHGSDQSAEEFKQEVESDPSTAQSSDDDTERLRGG